MIKFIKMKDNAVIPTIANDGDAGFDISSIDKHVIRAGGRELIATGISVEIPPTHYGRVSPRSGLAVKHGIDVGAGVVDSSYRGELMVLLFNHGHEPFIINEGDRIAQMVFNPVMTESMEWHGTASETERGADAFGSTGK